jgi:hypothetical protein
LKKWLALSLARYQLSYGGGGDGDDNGGGGGLEEGEKMHDAEQ